MQNRALAKERSSSLKGETKTSDKKGEGKSFKRQMKERGKGCIAPSQKQPPEGIQKKGK